VYVRGGGLYENDTYMYGGVLVCIYLLWSRLLGWCVSCVPKHVVLLQILEYTSFI